MSVIINDFEMILEPQPTTVGKQSNAERQKSESTSPIELRPQDVERIVRHFEERRTRLRAD